MAILDSDFLAASRDIIVGSVDNISDAIDLNAATSVTIVDAISNEGPKTRRHIIISNSSAIAVWIKEQAASIDNDKKGIYLAAKGVLNLYNTGIIYQGEISAIAELDNPSIHVVEK